MTIIYLDQDPKKKSTTAGNRIIILHGLRLSRKNPVSCRISWWLTDGDGRAEKLTWWSTWRATSGARSFAQDFFRGDLWVLRFPLNGGKPFGLGLMSPTIGDFMKHITKQISGDEKNPSWVMFNWDIKEPLNMEEKPLLSNPVTMCLCIQEFLLKLKLESWWWTTLNVLYAWWKEPSSLMIQFQTQFLVVRLGLHIHLYSRKSPQHHHHHQQQQHHQHYAYL